MKANLAGIIFLMSVAMAYALRRGEKVRSRGAVAALAVGLTERNAAEASVSAEEDRDTDVDVLSDASTAASLGYEKITDSDLQSLEVPFLATRKHVVEEQKGIAGRLRRFLRVMRLLIRRAVQKVAGLFRRRSRGKENVCWFVTIPEEAAQQLALVRSVVRQVGSAGKAPADATSLALHKVIPRGVRRRYRTESGERVFLTRRDFLGGGSFGRVYELCGEGPSGCFAAKFMRVQGLNSSKEALRLLQNETAILKLFPHHKTPEDLVKKHRMAVPIHLIRFDSSKTTLALTDGSSLINGVLLMPRLHTSVASLVEAIRGDFSGEANAVRESLARQFLQVLASMEELGLLHGDVKHANLFVASSGKVYLGDFGFAVPVGSKTSCHRFSPIGLPPEQARCVFDVRRKSEFLSDEPAERGVMRANFKTDAWAVGTMIFRLWCKGQPFKSLAVCRTQDVPCVENFIRNLAALKDDESVDFSSCAEEMPPLTQVAVKGLLAINPQKRLCTHCALLKIIGSSKETTP